jgi:hypothetical protein
MKHTDNIPSAGARPKPRDLIKSSAWMSVIYLAAGVAGLYFMTFVEVFLGIDGAYKFSPAVFAHATYLLMAWLSGWWAILLILPGYAILSAMTYSLDRPDFVEETVTISLMIIIAPLIYRLLQKILGHRYRETGQHIPSWKVVILGAVLASGLTYWLSTVVASMMGRIPDDEGDILIGALLDIGFLLTIMTVLMFVFRWIRFMNRNR